MTAKEMLEKMKSRGGLVAHLGVNDRREVEKMIENGDEHAKLIYDAMALNVARKIALHRLSYIRVRKRWNLWHLADFVYCADRKKHMSS